MKRTAAMILLFLVFGLGTFHAKTFISFKSDPEYAFNLAWEGPPHASSKTHFKDLNGEGLTEIVYFDEDENGNAFLTALDAFGNTLWSTQIDKQAMYILMRDIDHDGSKEIVLTTRLTSQDEEAELHTGKRRIACYTAEGTLLWAHEMVINPEWDGTYFKRLKISSFIDVDGDGYEEYIKGNLLLEEDGTILYRYGEDYSVVGSSDPAKESDIKIIFAKEKNIFFKGYQEYAFSCRICSLDGTILWEKKYTKETDPVLVRVEGEDHFFLVQVDSVTEVDLTTFEETRIALDFSQISAFIAPELEIVDLDNDGNTEYVITATDMSDFGKGAIFVFDSAFNLLWSHTGPTFKTDIEDLDGDETYEFCLDYEVDFTSVGASPTFFQVLNYDDSERWTILFDDYYDHPDFIDIDADGDTEILFEIDLRPKPSDDLSLEEALERLREYFENPPEEPEPEYLYVFGPEGNIEKQITIPSSGYRDFQDLDGDGDTDIFYHIKGEGIYVYTNTRFRGLLDEISGKESLEEVTLGDQGFKRDNLPNITLYYEYQRMKEFFRYPIFSPVQYRKKMTAFLSILLVLAFLLCFFVVRRLKREESNWGPLWGFKRVLLYSLLLVVSPIGLVYFSYKILKSSEAYRRGLGFRRISLRQVALSAAAGVILLFASWGVTFLVAINHVSTPSTGTQELVESSLMIAIFLIVVTAPFVEEILFSGYMYPVLRRKLGVKGGITLTALIFAVLHLSIISIPPFFVGAVLKTYAYERTHCIYVPMIIHLVNNALVVSLISLLL
jgi:membrane protease YdiL (CAAX protease family)